MDRKFKMYRVGIEPALASGRAALVLLAWHVGIVDLTKEEIDDASTALGKHVQKIRGEEALRVVEDERAVITASPLEEVDGAHQSLKRALELEERIKKLAPITVAEFERRAPASRLDPGVVFEESLLRFIKAWAAISAAERADVYELLERARPSVGLHPASIAARVLRALAGDPRDQG